ncbi:CBS domain-containing protein [Saccharopolyspora rosea]|uniref:Cyclic nucleotide-binding/CBS domain-containing protein n=1 Tax=Saccharopolyspora rosea TaxID=524884 RepID=A0ABW3FNP6_9PSEU|nr:CBS domain-containing protein [Saccharopolyspora rosea]
MRVEEAYRPGTLTCEAGSTLEAVATRMHREQVGVLAVLEADRIVGIISERDLVRAIAEQADLPTTPVTRYATKRLETAEFGEDTRDVARRMLNAGVRHLPVLRGGLVVGVVSMRDLLAVEAWL